MAAGGDHHNASDKSTNGPAHPIELAQTLMVLSTASSTETCWGSSAAQTLDKTANSYAWFKN
jgi:hypothetical protein